MLRRCTRGVLMQMVHTLSNQVIGYGCIESSKPSNWRLYRSLVLTLCLEQFGG